MAQTALRDGAIALKILLFLLGPRLNREEFGAIEMAEKHLDRISGPSLTLRMEKGSNHWKMTAWLLAALFFCASSINAQQIEPLIDTFDGGWRSGERSVECSFQGQSYRLEMTDGTARLALDGEYQPPAHIRYSPGSVLYIFGDDESGTSGAAFDFVNNEMVRRDFVPGEGESHPYSDRIPCVEVEK